LERTLATLEARIAISVGRFGKSDELDRLTVLHTIRGVNRFLEEMQEAADWISKSHASDLHLGTLYFIDQLSTDLIGQGVCVSSIPDGRYGYSSLSWPFKHILEENEVPDPTAGSHPAVITYLPYEGDSTLLAALFAHEVAHATVEENDLVQEVLEATTESFDRVFESLAEKLARESDEIHDVEEKLREQVTSWITELLCDAFATQYLGPSYLFAFAPTVIATGLDQFSGTHPPTAIRVRHILEVLERGGWAPVLEEVIPEIHQWLIAIGKMDTPPANAVELLCLETCDLFQQRVFEIVSKQLDTNAFEAGKFKNQHRSAVLMEFLEQRVLPAQMPDESAADRRSILLAGWLFKLKKDRVEDIALALEDDEFQAFLTAALEMSFVLEAWKSK
jgi:hypothetical protein